MNIEVICSECGADLRATVTEDRIVVDNCETCKEHAEEAAYRNGFNSGVVGD